MASFAFSNRELRLGFSGSFSTAHHLAEVLDCKLTWCVKTYSSSKVQGGVLEDKPSLISPLYVNEANCHFPPHSQPVRCAGYKAIETQTGYNRPYWLDVSDIEAFRDAFSDAFNTNTSTQSPISNHLYYANGRNFSRTLEDVATSVTNSMRNSENATTIRGTGYHAVTYVKVNWYISSGFALPWEGCQDCGL